MKRRFIGAVVFTLMVASVQAASAAPRISSHESGIRLTSKTVTVDRATVKQNLLGIATNGTFKFRRAAGALSRLKVGKVLLLQAYATTLRMP